MCFNVFMCVVFHVSNNEFLALGDNKVCDIETSSKSLARMLLRDVAELDCIFTVKRKSQ